MKRILLIGVAVFVVLLGGAVIFFLNGQGLIKEMTINDLDLSIIENGSYTGSFDGSRWSNEVEVIVEENKIVEISIIKDQMFTREDVTEVLFNNIKESQSLQVDTITEATVTSKAYLKAVENALLQ